jgi:hypothetical protein
LRSVIGWRRRDLTSCEVLRGLREVVEAQEIIARFDTQLFLRGRPRKVYRA